MGFSSCSRSQKPASSNIAFSAHGTNHGCGTDVKPPLRRDAGTEAAKMTPKDLLGVLVRLAGLGSVLQAIFDF
jgi:hypothetical protein